MAYGDPIASPIPTVLVTAGPTYADQINAWLAEVEARLEAKVTPAGMSINDSLDFANNALLNVDSVQLEYNLSTKTGALNARRLYSFAGELYYTNNSGTTLRITNGGAIDVASVRGITGDYSADTNAELDYSTASERYRCRANSGLDRHARVQCGDLRLMGVGNNPAQGVAVKVPALSASYDLTVPAAVPAGGTSQLLQMGSTGAVTLAPTLPGATSLLTITAAGVVAATISSTAPSFTSLTVTDPDVKHGDTELILPATLAHSDGWAFIASIGAVASGWSNGAISTSVVCGIPVKVGDRIKSVHANVRDTAGGNTVSFYLFKSTTGDANTQVGATQTSLGIGAPEQLSVTGLTETVISTVAYHLVVRNNTGTTTTNKVFSFRVVYDRP